MAVFLYNQGSPEATRSVKDRCAFLGLPLCEDLEDFLRHVVRLAIVFGDRLDNLRKDLLTALLLANQVHFATADAFLHEDPSIVDWPQSLSAINLPIPKRSRSRLLAGLSFAIEGLDPLQEQLLRHLLKTCGSKEEINQSDCICISAIDPPPEGAISLASLCKAVIEGSTDGIIPTNSVHPPPLMRSIVSEAVYRTDAPPVGNSMERRSNLKKFVKAQRPSPTLEIIGVENMIPHGHPIEQSNKKRRIIVTEEMEMIKAPLPQPNLEFESDLFKGLLM